MPPLKAPSPGSKLIAPPQSITIQASQKLRRTIAVEIRQAERICSCVPSRAEPEEIGERNVGEGGFCGEHCVDARVRVVDAGAVLRGEFG